MLKFDEKSYYYSIEQLRVEIKEIYQIIQLSKSQKLLYYKKYLNLIEVYCFRYYIYLRLIIISFHLIRFYSKFVS